MDGPAHYHKAEELAEKAAEYLGQGDGQNSAGVWAAHGAIPAVDVIRVNQADAAASMVIIGIST